jgi:hypothetical protein
LALTSPTGGGRSVGIVRSRTKATEFSLVSFTPTYTRLVFVVPLLMWILTNFWPIVLKVSSAYS